MTPLRAILVSDTHLSQEAPEAGANWAAVLRYVTAAPPDLVIHLGDLSLDGAHEASDLDYARRQLDLLPVPWHAVPGNHDIGDNPWPGAPDGLAVDDRRRQRWLDVVGPDYWALSADGWLLLAINAQLAGSGLAAEAEQWSWLADQLSSVSDGQRIALLTHKPLTAPATELAAAPPYRFWPAAARDHLAGMIAGQRLALFASGHVHQSRQLSIDGTQHLWVPTTWAVLPDDAQPVLGAKRSGIVSLKFGASIEPEPDFVEPAGIAQLTIRVDIPNRYDGR